MTTEKDLRASLSMTTVSGRVVSVIDPRPEDLDLALSSRLCLAATELLGEARMWEVFRSSSRRDAAVLREDSMWRALLDHDGPTELARLRYECEPLLRWRAVQKSGPLDETRNIISEMVVRGMELEARGVPDAVGALETTMRLRGLKAGLELLLELEGGRGVGR